MLEQRVESQKQAIERIEADFKEKIKTGNEKLDKIYDTLLNK